MSVYWPACDKVLRDGWALGYSASDIAYCINEEVALADRRQDVTRNAVIGRAHRLRLPPRPSPIIRRRRLLQPVHGIDVSASGAN